MWILDKIIPAPYRWAATGIVVLVLLGAIGVQTVRLANAEADLAKEKAAWATERARLSEAARWATVQLSDQAARHAAEQQEIVHAYNKEKQARLAAVSAARASGDSLRNDFRTYAAGSGLWAWADPSACRSERDRSATLGDLLADADRLAETLAGAAEQHAGEVRFLKRVIENDRAGCAPMNFKE